MHSVQVCFTPALFEFLNIEQPSVIVVIDVLRATTSMCTAFDFGAEGIIPLDSVETAMEFKKQGRLVAAERDGLKPDFADFSNSAFDYMNEEIKGKIIYYTTTNGTKAIKISESHGTVAIGSFLNLPSLAKWLSGENSNVIILCAGWKDNFCIEDTICAGALIQLLIETKNYSPDGDAAVASLLLWKSNSDNLVQLIKNSSHYERLEKLGFGNILSYSLKIGHSNAVPVLTNGTLINVNKNNPNKIH